MVYAFECEPCQIRVYSASPRRARRCPLCGEPMHGAPLVERGGDPAAALPPVDVPVTKPAHPA